MKKLYVAVLLFGCFGGSLYAAAEAPRRPNHPLDCPGHPLFRAVENQDLTAVNSLLTQTHIYDGDRHGYFSYALGLAVEKSTPSGTFALVIAENLLNAGASADIPFYTGLPIDIAVRKGDFGMVRLLLSRMRAQTVCDHKTILAAAGNESILAEFVRHGVDVDVRSCHISALHAAVEAGNERVVDTLLRHGANPHIRAAGLTPLHKAAERGAQTIAESLLDRGAMVNIPSSRGFTALHYAARNGYTGVARLLLDRGARVNLQNRFGLSPLHYAAEGRNEAIALLLLSRGADPTLLDKRGLRARDHCLKRYKKLRNILFGPITKFRSTVAAALGGIGKDRRVVNGVRVHRAGEDTTIPERPLLPPEIVQEIMRKIDPVLAKRPFSMPISMPERRGRKRKRATTE